MKYFCVDNCLVCITDYNSSLVYGSIIDGIFRGVIVDPVEGNFYVEESTLFFESSANHNPLYFPLNGHSVVYHKNAVKMPRSRFVCINEF